MQWFDEWVDAVTGSDRPSGVGRGYQDIADIADVVLDDERMRGFVREFFGSQKQAADFIGVGESTMAGWLKKGECPAYAKRGMLGAYYVSKHWRAVEEAKRDAERPKVVKDGDAFIVVKFKTDEHGVVTGEVLARDIPSEKTARVFASSLQAWELAKALEDALATAYWTGVVNDDGTEDDEEPECSKLLRARFRIECLRAFAPEALREQADKAARLKREAIESLADVEVEL